MIAETVAPALPRTCPPPLVGGAAWRLLASGAAWRVFATFRRSVYCRSGEGSLLCVGTASIGAGPLNVVAGLPERLDLEPGAPVEWDGAALRVYGGLVLPLTHARIWRPTPLPAGWDARGLARGLTELRAQAQALAPRDGLAPLVARADADTPLLRAARDGIRALTGWMREGTGVPSAAAAGLIGLGPGLTPSGDDFVGGALIGLRVLGRGDAADRLAAWVLPPARERTNAISAAHLACAATGEGMAALHETLGALCAPGAPGLQAWLDALDAVGHTSGWDALAGLAVAAATVAGAGPWS